MSMMMGLARTIALSARWCMVGGVMVGGVLMFVGCASPLAGDAKGYRNWLDQDPSSWEANEGGTLHRRDTLAMESQKGDVDEDVDGSAALSLAVGVEGYVRQALLQNPSIHEAQRRVQRLSARVGQVTSLDDPMLYVAPFGEMAETAAGQVGLMAGLSQKLPFWGKLETRGRIADQDVAMAMARLEQTRLQVVADTRRAFWGFYFLTRAIETTKESRQLLAQFRQIAQAQYKAGTRSQTDVLRASVELSNLDSELITLSQRQGSARSMLNQLLGRPARDSLPEPGLINPENIADSLEDLLAKAAQRNPSLQIIHERIKQFRQRQKLAKLNRWPDLTVSVNYNAVDDEGLAMSANGDDQWWLGFGVNLPIWTAKYDAQEREALAGMFEGIEALTAERNRIAFAVHDAYLKVEAQQKLVVLFRHVIIPEAEQAVASSRSGYRSGRVDFLTLVDNWRKRLDFDLMYHRALAEMEQAVAEMERAIGQEVVRTPTTEPTPRPRVGLTQPRTTQLAATQAAATQAAATQAATTQAATTQAATTQAAATQPAAITQPAPAMMGEELMP